MSSNLRIPPGVEIEFGALADHLGDGFLQVVSVGPAPASPERPRMVMLPCGGDPSESIARARRRHPQAQLVILAEVFDFDAMRDCLAAGAYAYIFAPGRATSVDDGRSIPTASPGDLQRLEDSIQDLSRREMEVVECLAAGHSNKLVARDLGISEATVKVHVKAILRKLQLQNRTQIALWAHARGIVAAPQ